MIKQYYAPTPKKWRKIGDALLGISTMITGLSIVEEYKWLAIISLTLGVIGKFLTNLFTEDE
jgi:hypothetical protein